MAGQVQMVYIDPPYGIKYGSNFQPFTNKRDVKEKDEDLSQEPEMIKAFRDTWELGIHSYLSYLRNRLLLARELLSDTGSVFVQISDDNLNYVKDICNEVFGIDNYVNIIAFTKGSGLVSRFLPSRVDYLLWYAKDKNKTKYHSLYKPRSFEDGSADRYCWLDFPDGTRRSMTKAEKNNIKLVPNDAKIYKPSGLLSQGNPIFPFTYQGKTYNQAWKTNLKGLQNLAEHGRLHISANSLQYVRYFNDFSVMPITQLWDDTQGDVDKIYAVQTSVKVVQRCILMTTDPGDLVLDITCGSGTTAYVAEQWGRRWITCDTSRIALELAKERILTATFDYYKLQHPEQGIASGFVYKTVPHTTLKSIANNTPPETEILYDQPEVDKAKVRVSGPFTVEALPAPIGITDAVPLEENEAQAGNSSGMTIKQDNWRDELLKTGIVTKGGDRIRFTRLEPMKGTTYFQAEGETTEGKRAVVCFGSENKVMDARYVYQALEESTKIFPHPDYVVIAAFQFGPEAKDLLATAAINSTVLNVQMNTDLMTEDLRKGQRSSQSFWLIGQPDVSIIKHGSAKNRYKVVVNGFDYFDAKTGKIISGGKNDIAMWMLDIDYDGLCVEPEQVFFPMGGKDGGWKKLAKTLKAEIDPDLIEKYAGNESLWFNAKPNQPIAVKIIDNRGIEPHRVLKVGEE